jgi:hypothetical protein
VNGITLILFGARIGSDLTMAEDGDDGESGRVTA